VRSVRVVERDASAAGLELTKDRAPVALNAVVLVLAKCWTELKTRVEEEIVACDDKCQVMEAGDDGMRTYAAGG
jgi:hypothetical protein